MAGHPRGRLRGAHGGDRAGGVELIAGDLLELDAHAATGEPLARRIGVWFWAAGAHRDWSRVKANGSVGPCLKPLDEYRSRVSIVTGLRYGTSNASVFNEHWRGASWVLSAAYPSGRLPGGPTLDQLVARRLSGARASALHVGITGSAVGAGVGPTAISYGAVASPNPAILSPVDVFDEIFGGGQTPAGGSTPRDLVSSSVLDAVKTDAEELARTLGASDRARLEGYLEGIVELQRASQSLSTRMTEAAMSCARPTGLVDAWRDAWASARRARLAEINIMMSRLVAHALGCGFTNVFTTCFASAGSTPCLPPNPSTPFRHGAPGDGAEA